MSKTRTFLAIIALFATGCGPSAEEVLVDAWPDGSPKVINHYVVEGTDSILVKQVSYYESGHKRQEGGLVDGCREGKWKYWYEDGTLWVEGFYKEGAQSGPVTYYHPNGRRRSSGNYDRGLRTGKWMFWDEKGKKLKEIDYDH